MGGTVAPEEPAACDPSVVDDHLVLRYSDEVSIVAPGDPLSRRTSWTLEAGYIVLQVRNEPACLDHDGHFVVVDTSVRAEDGITTPFRGFVVPADSELAGTFNGATLVK